MFKRVVMMGFAAILAGEGSAIAAQPEFPTQAITLVVPFAAGGGPDVQARQFAQKFAEALGVSVVVENKVGAAGVVGAQWVKRAAADGYTILLGTSAHLLQKRMQPNVPFDPIKDFRGVSNVMTTPGVLVVNKDVPVQSVSELRTLLANEPEKHNYGSGGIGSPAHVAGASFLHLNSLKAEHIPQRGSVELASALLRGDITFAFPVAGTALPQISAGKLRALAVTSEKRISVLPDTPTLYEESGDKSMVQETWLGLWVPKNTPTSSVEILHRAAVQALSDPELRAQFERTGTQAAPSKSPGEFDAYISEEAQKWGELADLLNQL